MTEIERITKLFEDSKGIVSIPCPSNDSTIILEALREYSERHEPKPLDIEQLKAWDGSVWLVCSHWQGWAFPFFLKTDNRFYFQCKQHEGISRCPDDYLLETNFGWSAYRYPPRKDE